MNLKEIRAEIVKDNDDSISNAELTGWINRALDDLSLVARYMRTVTVSLVNGQYTLPSDFMEIVSTSCNLSRLPVTDFESEGYKIIGNVLQVQNSNATGFTMVYIASLPHLVGDLDIPVLPVPYHDLLVLYPLFKAKFVDELTDMYYIAKREYTERKADFARYVGKTQSVPHTKNVYVGGWNS